MCLHVQEIDLFLTNCSNDMRQFHRKESNYHYRLPLMRDKQIVEWEPDQRLLALRYTEAAVDLINRHAEDPLFVYIPHSMPHIPSSSMSYAVRL